MKRAIPVLVLTAVGLIPVWRYQPSTGTTTTTSTARPATTPTASSSSSGSAKILQGTAVDTEKGVVQVEVTLERGRITAVRMLQAPDHPQTKAAVPKLIAETLTAQSARIDTVTGATITSDGYKQSLQAALDAKGA